MRSTTLLTSALVLVTLAACGSSSSGTGGASTTTTISGAAGAPTTSTTTTAAGGGGSGGATSTTSSTTTGTGGSVPINACTDINATDCFSNLDCMTADRCENKGTPDIQVPCCVPGPRGAGKLGDPCAIDNDCATSLCVETTGGYLCSGECTMDADCTSLLPTCTDIPAILGTGSFCLPT